MTYRIAALIALPVCALLQAGPAAAQAPDFGDDASQWSRDGECDDPRFEGAGMSDTALLEADARHDATDCKAAFDAGTIVLAGGTASTTPPVKGSTTATTPATTKPTTPATTPTTTTATTTPTTDAPLSTPAPVNYGDDSSEFAKDGECDDRRFAGEGLASDYGWDNTGRDATDCRSLAEAGKVHLWDWDAAQAATQCAAIDFGDDASQYARNGSCDDPRFEGFGMADVVNSADAMHDASDCVQLCAYGVVALRDY